MRADDTGGAVVSAREDPPGAWLGRRRIVLFVHGFNNTYQDAQESYRKAVARLAGEVPPNEDFPDGVCRFYWPGDADLGGLSFMSFVSYPVEIDDAVKSAGELAAFLRRVYQEDDEDAPLTILAHSLGCRVVLELVERLRDEDWFRAALAHVCLMAAAVDVDTVAAGGVLEDAARFCATRKLTIIASDGDRVLHYAFPLGSTLAEPGSGRALGRFGPPPGLAGVTSAWRIDALDHGHYWPLENPELRRVVAEAIGIATTATQLIPRSSAVHETEPARELPGRQTPVWEAP